MIRFDRVSVTYDGAAVPVLRDVDLHLDEGELVLVVGHTGTGKSTLLGAVNGLVPHFTGGTLTGRVTVAGRDTAHHPPRELADLVGVVGQDPVAGFVTDTVEEELAYGMEQLALDPRVMRARVEEALDLLGLAELRHRGLHQLSGGQQQRVAIAAALTAHPRVLVLDEPTSALDPTGAEDVLAAITRLVHDLGITVVLAEHRLERVVPYADRVVHLAGDGTVSCGDPAAQLAASTVAPPVVELARHAGWTPVPLSVRDARRRAAHLRDRLPADPPPHRTSRATEQVELAARGVIVRHGPVVAVRGVDLDLRRGEVTALMGRNGSGKSSLLWAVQGSGRRDGGTVAVRDGSGRTDPRSVSAARARALVGLVPQTATDLLYLDTVGAELAQADRDGDVLGSPGAAAALLDAIAPGIDRAAHPRDLSAGQQLALVLAVQLAVTPGVVLLDEPTRGLDYRAKQALAATVDTLAARGHAVVVATHDVEFATLVADRVVVMADGEVVADGPAAAVLTASPSFAPQVAKILAPAPYLTVGQVRAALPEEGV
ncbi:cobalt ABC transporter ATP-binding protein [Catellatospora sp. TT07R-123]|uniref:ABC transporter ATP-binding protein n=1 Tax=Catellatospora sp. TT07R-123 TaxID=2733863 RepID=UPI001B02F869|nr:ABC transporter ATP-binding protein [Catellatospora sp. TT07R-123]GHJ43993.1 cobalt ABC transporter ATP-binding protein [Catellatospora sp. TT07R-123]